MGDCAKSAPFLSVMSSKKPANAKREKARSTLWKDADAACLVNFKGAAVDISGSFFIGRNVL
jgi:hypothetical protein